MPPPEPTPAALQPALDVKPFILLHVPKTCGTSFRRAVEYTVGRDRIVYAYTPEEPETSQIALDTLYGGAPEKLGEVMRNSGSLMISGHFPYANYLPYLEAFSDRWCVFFRDPVQRVLSEYKHKVRHNNLSKSLEDYAKAPLNRNVQYRMTEGLPLDQWHFIGISERYAESLRLFESATGLALPNLEENLGKPGTSAMHTCSASELRVIKEMNEQDLALYQRARQIFEERLRLADGS